MEGCEVHEYHAEGPVSQLFQKTTKNVSEKKKQKQVGNELGQWVRKIFWSTKFVWSKKKHRPTHPTWESLFQVFSIVTALCQAQPKPQVSKLIFQLQLH